MDRISQLPDFIVHHILSFFDNSNGPPVELVRMSVLSKTWFHLTASFPILDFRMYNFRPQEQEQESFYKYVVYTTSRFCHQNVTAHRLKLSANIEEPAELDIINRCVERVLNKGVRELEIEIINLSDIPKYRLPDTLLSVSVLRSLTINGCELPSSLMVDAVKLSLIQLRLEDVTIDDEVIKYLATRCPLLQVFEIISCPGFNRFCVHGHQNLQEVRIEYYTPIESIDIEAPNLSRLWVADWDQRGAPRMNLTSCKNLKTVSYLGHPSPNSNGFNDLLSNFPVIENLVLVTQYPCNNLRLSSHSLRTLVLRANCDLEEIEFRTPKLVSFCYPFNRTILWPLVWHSTYLKPCMQIYPGDHIDTLWFQKLRQFLDKENGFKVFNLFLHAIYYQKLIDLEKLKAIGLPPYELEHVELQLEAHEESSDRITFLDAVLWCCRPRSITLRSSHPLTDFEEQSDLVKFTYKKLLEQEDKGHTNVHIVSPSSSKAKKHFRGLVCEGKAISFIKEQGMRVWRQLKVCGYGDLLIDKFEHNAVNLSQVFFFFFFLIYAYVLMMLKFES
ncbi:putative leucine-rich repeat domain superfamily, F-box-like domain superfamily [Helianthus annuus]|nr:putative leucine-rich repeat domain superfamily, F-box-like domain superfamily [Helianthus annuus]